MQVWIISVVLYQDSSERSRYHSQIGGARKNDKQQGLNNVFAVMLFQDTNSTFPLLRVAKRN